MTTKKKSNLAERAAAVQTAKAAQPTTATRVPASPVRTDRVRLSLALDPQAYDELLALARAYAVDLGIARLPHVEILRVIVDELLADPSLRDRVLGQLRSQRG